MDNPVLKAEGVVSLDVVSARSGSPFRVKDSPTETMKNIAIQEVDAKIRQTWDRTKCAELGISDHYTSVAALIIHWARNLDEDLKSWKEVEQLDQVLRDDFNFNSKVVILDNAARQRPQLQLNKAIMDFVHDNDGPYRTNLLIVYYTGHGFTYTDRPTELIIAGTEDGNLRADNNCHKPQANWTGAEGPLDDAEADTLVILDCCSASNIMKAVSEHSRSYELMAATGKDKPTAAGPKSYTTALIKSLKILQAREDKQFNTYDLNQMIIRQRDWNTASQLYNRRSNLRTRHIVIAPPVELRKSQSQKPDNCAGYLDIRIAFENNSALKYDQVKRICSELCKLPKTTDLKICDLEFLGFTPRRDSPQFKKLVGIFKVRHMFRKAAQRFKEKKRNQDPDHSHCTASTCSAKRKRSVSEAGGDTGSGKRRQVAGERRMGSENNRSRSLDDQTPLSPPASGSDTASKS